MNPKSNPSKPAAPVEKPFCTTREAGDLLGVSAGTVQLWVDNGLLQAWKTAGGHRRVVLESVRQLLQKTPAAMVPRQEPASFVAAVRPLKMVVVDDDPHMLALYQRHLAAWPMVPEISYIDNAVAALLSMGRNCPDLLVTDLHMPGMDGFNMLRVLRQAPDMAHTTIVVVSALDAEEISRRGGIPEGIELLAKPVAFDRLLAIAAGVYQQVQMQRPATASPDRKPD
jgi:excisionase family DNA binding protein